MIQEHRHYAEVFAGMRIKANNERDLFPRFKSRHIHA